MSANPIAIQAGLRPRPPLLADVFAVLRPENAEHGAPAARTSDASRGNGCRLSRTIARPPS